MKAPFKSRITRVLAAAAVMVLVPATVAFALSGNYTGTTSQGKKCGSGHGKCTVKIHVVKNVVQQDSHILWKAKCSNGSLGGNTAMHGPLKKGNKFHVQGSYVASAGGGFTATDTVNLSFTVKAHKAPGTLTASAVVRNPNGGVVDHCHTGKVKFTAHK